MATMEINKLPLQAQVELADFYEFLLQKYATQELEDHTTNTTPVPLGQLAVSLFGEETGLNLDLPHHTPHLPIEF